MKKKLIALGAAVLASTMLLVACASPAQPTLKETTQKKSETKAASEVKTVVSTTVKETIKETNKVAVGSKPVLLVVSFGTSYNENRVLTIDALEQSLAKAYPDYEVRRAFTSQIIIDKLAKRDNLKIDNVDQAMSRLVADGIKKVVIQPTHVMPGSEYNDVLNEVKAYVGKFESVKFGNALLAEDKDFIEVAEILKKETAKFAAEDSAIVFMGHGTKHEANAVYTQMQGVFEKAAMKNYYIGTVEATPTIDEVLAAVKKTKVKKVVLMPFMIVAGDHANNDMAGDEEDSWKSVFKAAGYEVETVIKGMAEYESLRQLFVKRVAAATEMAKTASVKSDEKNGAQGQIQDGKYPVTVKSSSDMFKVVKAELSVKAGKMSLLFTLSGKGYDKVFVGSGEEALKAKPESYVKAQIGADDQYSFEIPVETTDRAIKCAAWSVKKSQWYDRELTVVADSLPATAFKK